MKALVVISLLSIFITAYTPQSNGLTPRTPQEIESMLIVREQEKWGMFRAGTFAKVSNMYADDFINIAGSPAGTFRQNKQESDAALASMPSMDGEIALSEFLVVHPDENTAVVSYKVTAFFGSEYVTSVWAQRDGEWVTVFFQGLQNDDPSDHR